MKRRELIRKTKKMTIGIECKHLAMFLCNGLISNEFDLLRAYESSREDDSFSEDGVSFMLVNSRVSSISLVRTDNEVLRGETATLRQGRTGAHRHSFTDSWAGFCYW
jgi:hypothetical protein